MGYGKKYSGSGEKGANGVELANFAKQIPKKTYTPIGCLVAFYMYAQGETAGGVVLPEGVQDPMESVRCLVIAVGPECKQLKVGDEFIMGNAPPMRCTHAKQVTFLIREDNIAGVVDEEYMTKRREPALAEA